MNSNNRFCLLIDSTNCETKSTDLCYKKKNIEDLIDKQKETIYKLINSDLNQIIKDTDIYESFQYILPENSKEKVYVIKDSINKLKENHTYNPSINFNFIKMFDNNKLLCIIDIVLKELLQSTNYSVIIEDTLNSNEYVDGYVLLIENKTVIDSEKMQLIKWTIRQCVISICPNLGSSKTIFNVNKKNNSMIMYFDFYLHKSNLEDIEQLQIIVKEFNKIISCVGNNDFEVDDIGKITKKISILEEKRDKIDFKCRDELENINSELRSLYDELVDDVESSFKKKGKGSKIGATIFNDHINLIIPYKYNGELTGFEQILYSIIEMMYLLLKKFCQSDEAFTESKLEMFLNSYFKGDKKKRPLLLLKLIDKPFGINKKYIAFKSDKLFFVKNKCGEKFQEFIKSKYNIIKNTYYDEKRDYYVKLLTNNKTDDKLQSFHTMSQINLEKIKIINWLQENGIQDIKSDKIKKVASLLVENLDNLRKF